MLSRAWYHARPLRAALVPFSWLAGIALWAGCAGKPPERAKTPTKPAQTETKRAPLPPWDRFSEIRAWPALNEQPLASRGHGNGAYVLDVRVSPESRDAYLALLPGSTIAAGTIVAAFHRDPRRGGAGPVYVMEKGPSGWAFRALDAEGRPSEHGVDLCRRCHAEAPADSLFGLPKK
jgi:hypothetical protein